MLEVWYESSRRRPSYRHQIVEIPPIVPQVAEHRFHQLVCPDCGCGTRALIPEIVEHGYGVNVVAHVGLLSSLYRHSHRLVQQASTCLEWRCRWEVSINCGKKPVQR